MSEMRQYAPYPFELQAVIDSVKGPPEVQRITLRDIERDSESQGRGVAGGLTLELLVVCEDSYHPGEMRRVRHLHPVPAATYNKQAWVRWVFDCIQLTRTHELGEYFEVDGVHPFAALHGPGDNPYIVHEYSTDLQRRTAWTGEVHE